MRRLSVVGVLAAAVVAGSLFAPVFGTAAVLWPMLAVVVVVYLVEEAILRRPRLTRWRVPFTLVGGVIALLAVIPGAARRPVSLWQAVTSGWRRTLESTWPASPVPDLVAFVPVLVLFACLVGVRVLQRSRVLALLPAVLVAGLSQAYVTVAGVDALLAGLALAGCFALVLLDWPGDRGAWFRLVAALAAMAVGATTLGLTLPSGASVHLSKPAPPDSPTVLSNPLTEIAARLRSPDTVVFTARADGPVDRWPVIALDTFDGVTWTAAPKFQRLGRELPLNSHVTVQVRRQSADVALADWSLPWLPSQTRTLSVVDDQPLLVDPASGALLAAQSRPSQYRINWAEPAVDVGDLASAGVDSDLSTGADLGEVPVGIDELAREIAGDVRPSFQLALVLEKYLRANYKLAAGDDLPTGHGYPQLNHFLLRSKRGTSEQFAASYVVMARLLGLPARLVVGFKQPDTASPDGTYVVRNRDVLAWPEVAVAGVGWVPLDPTGTATSKTGGGGLASAAEAVRKQMPSTKEIEREHQAEPTLPAAKSSADHHWPGWVLLIVAGVGVGGVLLLWVVGVPLVKVVRRRRRRRRGTVGAWAEARDLLRDHGMRVSPAATARDLARESDGPVSQAMTLLAGCLDRALWSGQDADPDREFAWSAVRKARRGLADGRLTQRIRTTLSPRSLFS
ncbi:transglutaminaseTgpA domain-containing protein [Kribbella solani]|uniref:Transglutaminase-like putative cysteine protease n=1 Tax=Kribbella solani TaxID=236067 RepID=A0A841E196_9ACTN|nr:transglutaminase domain-containing protein [Kribbella solani]MBB5981178.1 transglutaminase-like putative cysteine protease [Kribbella solani]